jgi:hypothetical protein
VSKRWHNLFLCTKPRLSQAQALLLPKVFVSLGIKFFIMAKLHFRPYIPNQTVLFPGRIDENIAANDPVRIVNTVVDNLNLGTVDILYVKADETFVDKDKNQLREYIIYLFFYTITETVDGNKIRMFITGKPDIMNVT